MPSAGATISKLALSVSTSAMMSPAATESPLCLSQADSRHSCTVLPSFGISTVVATSPGLLLVDRGHTRSGRPLRLNNDLDRSALRIVERRQRLPVVG